LELEGELGDPGEEHGANWQYILEEKLKKKYLGFELNYY
jgi:hypothetical protein